MPTAMSVRSRNSLKFHSISYVGYALSLCFQFPLYGNYSRVYIWRSIFRFCHILCRSGIRILLYLNVSLMRFRCRIAVNPSILLRQHDSHIETRTAQTNEFYEQQSPFPSLFSFPSASAKWMTERAVRLRKTPRTMQRLHEPSSLDSDFVRSLVLRHTISFDILNGHSADASSIHSRAALFAYIRSTTQST